MARMNNKGLAKFSRQLATTMQAGLPIRRALDIMGRKGSGPGRKLLGKLAGEIDNGATFSEAMERQGPTFPLFFTRMVKVGEQAGSLEEIFKSLADYYDMVIGMWRAFWKKMFLPVIEYCLFVVVISILAYVMAMILEKSGNPAVPAFKTFLFWGSLPFALMLLYILATRIGGGKYMAHRAIMSLPVLGKIFQAFSLWRFCWCMHLMTESGVQIFNSIMWSADATANQVFIRRAPAICQDLKDGVPLHDAMANSELFTDDVLEMIHVGEESGSSPDLFRRLSEMYREKAEFAMGVLTTVASFAFYGVIMAIIGYHIITLAMRHMNTINDLLNNN